MKIAFILDPLDKLKAYKDSSIAMLRAAARRGHQVFAIHCAKPSSGTGRHRCRPAWRPRPEATHPTTITPGDRARHRETGSACQALTAFDAVLMRQDPPFDFEYVTATWLLESAADAEGARIFNKPRASIRDHSEKLAIAEFNQYTVPTLVARDMHLLQHFIDEQRDVVVKPLDGMGGSQVFRLHRNDPNRNAILETLSHEGRRTIMAQRYLPEIVHGDKRILVIDGKVVPYCLARIPKAGETRGNLAVGGTGVAQELSARDRAIAEGLAPVLKERGLFLVGLDVIGDHLTEINVTSPTCMVEIRQQTGYDAASAFISALEHACAAH